MTKRALIASLSGLVAFCFLAFPAVAQSVQVLGDFRAWSSYTANDGSGAICFAVTKPTSTQPEPDGYADAHIYVTHRPSEGVRAEFNLIAGYEFAVDTVAAMKIGSRVIDLHTEGDAAWLLDASIANDVAGYIRAGSTLVIEGTTVDGIRIVQTFSLSGATAAQRAIDAAC